MAEIFMRSSIKVIPVFTLRTWQHIAEHQEGRKAMAIINSIFVITQIIPEVVVHSIS
jgi:hypothetical protein